MVRSLSTYAGVAKELFLSLLAAMVCLGAASRADAQSYTFTTLAGSAGQIGDSDGTNSAARFNSPAGITIDSLGNLYTAEFSTTRSGKSRRWAQPGWSARSLGWPAFLARL